MSLNKSLYSSASSEWETPQWLFDELNDEFNFSIDVCATRFNCKVRKQLFYTDLDGNPIPDGERLFYLKDCLEDDWHNVNGILHFNHTVFMNPPYSRKIGNFIKKAWEKSISIKVVCLLPARTDTKWWSIFWDRESHKPKDGCQVRFLEGRLKFSNAKNSAPFPSAVVVMDRRAKLGER